MMVKQFIPALRAEKGQGQSQSSATKYTRYVLAFCVLFIVSAVSFCPVTKDALAAALSNVLPPVITDLTFSFEGIAHLAFFGLLVVGLKMRTKYQD